jgi:iron complex outermembrane receptor protein
MQKIRFLSILFLFATSQLYSAQNDYSQVLQTINDELKSYEKTATITRNNEHYQPYIISVLKSDTLKKVGVRTLKEALELVTGVDVASDNLDYKSPIFRGSNPSAFGQSKLFIDGVLVNNVYFDGYSEYLDMPIEIIKRIEVIRGPGNEGEEIASYAGSIHVITYAEDSENTNSVFGKIGSNALKAGGFKKGYKKGDFSCFTDFYYQEEDKSLYVESDILKSGIYDIKTPWYTLNNSALAKPGEAPLWLKNYSFGLTMHYQDFSFKGRFYHYKKGAAFGFNYMVPHKNDSLEIPNHYAQLQYKKTFSKLEVAAKIGLKYDKIESHQHLIHENVALPKISDPTQSVLFEEGMYGVHEAQQKVYYHSLNMTYKGIENHDINFGYYLSKTDTEKVISKITDRDTGKNLTDYTNTLPFFDKDASRKSCILNIQDSYTYNDYLKLQYGINYENNSHINEQINPKISLVYNAKHDNIFKLLYASSHRTPSWQELYTLNNRARVGNKNLKAEKIDTFEIAHIKHFSHDSFIQTTLFYLINKDQIHNITKNNQYINSDKDNHLYGVELEYKGSFLPNDSIYLNLAYIDGENSYDNTLSQVSNLLAKGYYIYDIYENLSFATVAKYSSSKKRLTYDKRENIDAVTTFDMTLSYESLPNDYIVRLGIQNIFDTKVVYASKPYTYEEDYPRTGRNFTISFEKEF